MSNQKFFVKFFIHEEIELRSTNEALQHRKASEILPQNDRDRKRLFKFNYNSLEENLPIPDHKNQLDH